MSTRKGTKFTEGNQAAKIVHGGAGAVRRIQEGKPFVGLAAQEEANVTADLEAVGGRAALVKEAAVRLHTAMRLYWGAVQAAADAGDLEALDKFTKRFGWLANSALRGWERVRAEDADHAGAIDYEQVLAQKEGGGR